MHIIHFSVDGNAVLPIGANFPHAPFNNKLAKRTYNDVASVDVESIIVFVLHSVYVELQIKIEKDNDQLSQVGGGRDAAFLRIPEVYFAIDSFPCFLPAWRPCCCLLREACSPSRPPDIAYDDVYIRI